jgi:hypothetical protein
MQLVSGRGHYEAVVAAVLKAQRSVWVATANLKQMMVEGRRVSVRSRSRFRSVLDVFDELAAAGVELRILHASRPSGPFRERFDALPRLYEGGLELRECPRVHLKAVVVDGALVYLGSANWTGAGLGAKGEGRRNFEVGILTDDDEVLDTIQELYDRIWRGAECAGCRLRDAGCEAPLDLFSAERVVTASQRARQGKAGAEATSPAKRRSARRRGSKKKTTGAKKTASKETTAKKRASKKTTAKKKSAAKKKASASKKSGASKKTAALKKTASKRTASTTSASKKTAATSTASKETAATSTASKETASKETASRETASKKTAAAKKTAAKKTAS